MGMDNIAITLGLSELNIKQLEDITAVVNNAEHTIQDTSPFHAGWFQEIRKQNGREGFLVKHWNGSNEQKRHLRLIMKNRKITWGDNITQSKSNGTYQININGVDYFTASINKFCKQHGLNSATLRNSLWNKTTNKSKGRSIRVVLVS